MTKTNSTGCLAGRVAIVTGAGRGLGRCEALSLAAAGAKVVVNDLGGDLFGQGAEKSVAQAVVDEIKAAGGEAVANGDNIVEMAGAKRLIETALDSFGRLDILVNNAGIVRPKHICEMEEEDWDMVLAVHLKGHFTTTRHAAPIFCNQRSGVIINTASESGLGHYGMSNYSAAKEGIVGFTAAIARDIGRYGARCNAVRPRGNSRMGTPELIKTILTSQNELGYAVHGNRWVTMTEENIPEHVGLFVSWLCSDAAANVNGRNFFVGGGTVALYGTPEIERTMYRPEGWTLDLLDAESCRSYLIGDLTNPYQGPAKSQ